MTRFSSENMASLNASGSKRKIEPGEEEVSVQVLSSINAAGQAAKKALVCQTEELAEEKVGRLEELVRRIMHHSPMSDLINFESVSKLWKDWSIKEQVLVISPINTKYIVGYVPTHTNDSYFRAFQQ